MLQRRTTLRLIFVSRVPSIPAWFGRLLDVVFDLRCASFTGVARPRNATTESRRRRKGAPSKNGAPDRWRSRRRSHRQLLSDRRHAGHRRLLTQTHGPRDRAGPEALDRQVDAE